MLALTLNALAFSFSPELDLANVKQLKLELPNAYYSQSNSQEDWLTSLYTSSLAPAKELEPKTQEQINIYNAYLTDYYTDEDIAFFNEIMGRRPYELTLHTRAWGGYSSGYAQGFSYSEKVSPNLSWGFGIERAELKSSKNRYWEEGGYYNTDAWLDWQPRPDLRIIIGAKGSFQE